MTIEEVRKYYRTLQRACKRLGIADQNTTKWNKQGYIPWKLQLLLEKYTNGELVADEEDPLIRKRQGRL